MDQVMRLNCFLRQSGKFSSAFYFFKNTWKLQNRDCFGRKTLDFLINTPKTLLFWKKNVRSFNKYYPSVICHLVLNFHWNIRYEIAHLKKCQIKPFEYQIYSEKDLGDAKSCRNCYFQRVWTKLWSKKYFLRQFRKSRN